MADIATPLDTSRPYDYAAMHADGQQRAIWIFGRERLTISPDPAGDIAFVQGSTQPLPYPNGDETDVRWIADMRDVWPAASTIRPDCLPSASVPSAAVAMQLVIGSGLVASEFLSQTYLLSRFDPQKAALVDHSLTRRMLVTRSLDTVQQITIASQSLDGGAALGEIALNVPAGSDLEITAGNLELGDIITTASGGAVDHPLGPDPHFELYYPVLQTPSGEVLPVPVQHELQGWQADCYPLMTT